MEKFAKALKSNAGLAVLNPAFRTYWSFWLAVFDCLLKFRRDDPRDRSLTIVSEIIPALMLKTIKRPLLRPLVFPGITLCAARFAAYARQQADTRCKQPRCCRNWNLGDLRYVTVQSYRVALG